MTERFFYLSPLILPVLPSAAGRTVFTLNVENTLADVAPRGGDIRLNCLIEQFEAGEKKSEERIDIVVAGDRIDPPIIDRVFVASTLGYLQVSITAEQPYFDKILTEHVYSIVERPDGGTMILNAAYKYSDPLIIDLMRRVGRFCLVHPAHYVNASNGAGNSTLIVNPFDGPIVARLMTAEGREMRRRVAPREATMISLEDLIEDGQFTCVLYTGNNRYPAWDVRHAYGAPDRINRIDHLEFFRGNPTERRMPALAFTKSRIRSLLRSVGLRN